ncbi:hypothetical protein OF83DRAFT_1123068 [Amylostereum chailletii]|nr:hypothetical protein OF83DRAFT_1123068 [Amylostereum chailletii]
MAHRRPSALDVAYPPPVLAPSTYTTGSQSPATSIPSRGFRQKMRFFESSRSPPEEGRLRIDPGRSLGARAGSFNADSLRRMKRRMKLKLEA